MKKRTPIPTISICIPTFQRKEALRRTLQKLIESERLVVGKIEVCISDNASSDGTFKMLQDYAKRYPFIHIRKNSKNIGFDSNLLASFKMAHGRYCWGVGDDDTIVPRGVGALVMLLNKKESFLMGLAGAMAYKRDLKLVAKHFQEQEYSNKEFISCLISAMRDSSKITRSHQDITILGFLPCYFFNNKILKQSFRNLEGERYGWYHLALLFHIISNFKGTILVNKKTSLKHGQVIKLKKDSILLPGGDFDLFVTKRIETLSKIVVDTRLRKAFYSWLNVRGNYFYAKSLVELVVLSKMVSKPEYVSIKRRVYGHKNMLKRPFFVWLGTTFFQILEPLSLFRGFVSALYSKVHYIYIKQLEDYLKGRLQTHDEREGRVPTKEKAINCIF
ncbi:MAG: glycosyltransferase [Nanoarchaeota archaeon]|nr:glycosyltransferase [Nanoarchaeota archaeon]